MNSRESLRQDIQVLLYCVLCGVSTNVIGRYILSVCDLQLSVFCSTVVNRLTIAFLYSYCHSNVRLGA